MEATTKREWVFFGLLAALAALLPLLRPEKANDYRVYWEGARHYFAGQAPMYGPGSGAGSRGGLYRYPPLFLDLFRPLAALPLRWGAALWAVGKVLCAGGLAIALRRRWGLASIVPLWPGMLLLAPYLVQEVRGGNAQFYIVALVAGAWLLGERHPVWGGVGLGLAAALKAWPLFFLPCLLAQRRWRWAATAGAAFAGWTLLPALWRGWGAQWRLLWTWMAEERGVETIGNRLGQIWYPGQSLHDVMMRYLAVMDYSGLPDSHYRQVAWMHLALPTIEGLWLAAVVVLLAGLFAALAWGTGRSVGGEAAVAAMFCAVVVVEPHVHRIIFVTLLWPALWLAARQAQGGWGGARRALWWLAIAAAVVEPLVPGAARQRALQVYGMDFWLVLVPLTVLSASLLELRRSPDWRRPGAEAD